MICIDRQLMDLMLECADTGQVRETRSGKVRGVFRREISWDMRKGLPLPMAKSLYHKGVAAELLMFISGVPDRRIMQEFLHGDFNDDRWDIWKQDCERKAIEDPERFNGYNLGDMYPVAFRQKRIYPTGYVLIDRKYDLDADYQYVGDIKPTVQGVGVVDIPSAHSKFPKLYRIWQDMLIRCYGYRPQHEVYRDAGITVSPRWLVFSNFKNDCYALSGFQSWVSDPSSYNLDKDYFGSNVYSRNTCIFLESSVNKMLNGGGQGLRVFKAGDTILFGKSQLADHFGTYRQHDIVMRLHREGYEFEELHDSMYRPKIYMDPLQELVDNMTDDPTSRYMIVDNWNPEHKTKCVLGACHMNFQVYVDSDTNEFDLDFTLRSSDVFLGSFYNIWSYALLMKILEKLTGLTPRFLYASLKDAHTYCGHHEAIQEYVSREARMCNATLTLPEFESLDDLTKFKAEDFVLHNYHPDAPIKAPLSVG
ncbi:HNH endonuclease [Vibrio phage D148]